MENNFTNKLNQDDVVFFQEKDNHLFTKTFKISDFMSWMLKNLERVMNTQKQRQEANQFTTEGLACHVLRPGQQWKKGKIRIAVEFIPDEPDPEKEIQITKNQSLDEFRC